MFKPLEEQQQWELESQLGSCIDCLLSARNQVKEAEEALERARNHEARYLAEIRDYRRRLGLPDEPISYLQGDDCLPGDEPCADSGQAHMPSRPAQEG